MATPTFGLLNSQPLTTADNNTGWNDLTTADTDIKVEGANSMSGIFRADGEQGYYDSGTAPVSAAGKTLRGWILTNNLPYMGTMASDPYKLLAYDGTTTQTKNLFGSDTYPGGWYNYIWDMDDFTSLTLANVRRWGVESGHASNAKNVVNTWMDVIRYLDGYSMVGGTSGDKVRLADAAALDKASAYGVLTNVNNVFFATGTLQFGTGATTHYFEMSGQVLVFTEQMVGAGLYQLTGVGSGTNILIQNSVIKSVGSSDNTRFLIDMDDADLASMTFTGNLVTRSGTVNFKSGQTATGNTYDDCGIITPAGANISNSVVRNYGETADTAPTNGSAVVWNETTNPDGYLDGMDFTKGTAATHAIEFGTSSPTSMTLRNMTFSGYNASNNQNDSVLHFKRTSGTVTVTLVGTNTPSYRSDGATIVFVTNPVDTTVTTLTATGTAVGSCRVFLYATSTTGTLPAGATVTIANSGTTATVTHTAHGLSTSDKVWIKGASLAANNGVFEITVTGTNTYTYTMASSPGSSPTGTITSTFVFIKGLSNATTGVITLTRPLPANQSVAGWARKGSSADSPKYKTGNLAGTVSSTSGASLAAVMIPDE